MINYIEDQYYLYMDLDGLDNFCDGGGGIEKIIFEEKSGGSLPMFELVFETRVMDSITKLNEGSPINVKFGASADKSESMVWTIQKYNIFPQSSGLLKISCSGFISSSPSKWTAQTKVEFFDDTLNSLDVMKTLAQTAGFGTKIKTNETPGDYQVRIRYNIPVNKMFKETWEHSYISDSNFFIYACDRFGQIVIDDYINAASQEPKWNLNHTDESDVPLFALYTHSSNFGIINNITSYDRERKIHNIENGETLDIKTPKRNVILADSPNLNMTGDSPKIQKKMVTKSENHHDKYWDAYFLNYSNIGVHSSSEVEVSLTNKYKKFELFDLVSYTDISINDLDSDDSKIKKNLSGLFIITGITHYINRGVYGCTLLLTRETLNNQSGNLS